MIWPHLSVRVPSAILLSITFKKYRDSALARTRQEGHKGRNIHKIKDLLVLTAIIFFCKVVIFYIQILIFFNLSFTIVKSKSSARVTLTKIVLQNYILVALENHHMLLHTILYFFGSVRSIAFSDNCQSWDVSVWIIWFLCRKIVNYAITLVKNTFCVIILCLSMFFAPKLDMASITPLPWPDAP